MSFFLLLFFMAQALAVDEDETDPACALNLSKEVLAKASQEKKHTPSKYIRDLPMLVYKITKPTLADLPESIRNLMSAVDSSQYNDAYIARNIGSAIAFQVNGDKLDFYVLLKNVFEQKYKPIDFVHGLQKTSKMISKMRTLELGPLLDSSDLNLVFCIKKDPVEMYRLSQLGYPLGKKIIIRSSWGEQTKPAGQDAFLTIDAITNEHYIINADAEGLPIGYIPE